MGRMEYIAMKTDQANAFNSDMKDFGVVAKNVAKHVLMLGGLGFGTIFMQWVATVVALVLLAVDVTHLMSPLLTPYVFLCLPSVLFNFLRGPFGQWLAFISVLLQLSFQRLAPANAIQSASMTLLVVVAPDFIAETVRDGWAGSAICLVIGCIFLGMYIISSGYQNTLSTPAGIVKTIGLSLMIVYPILALILHATT